MLASYNFQKVFIAGALGLLAGDLLHLLAPREVCAQNEITLELAPGELWWGGAVAHASDMPFGAEEFSVDLRGDTRGNQAQPLLISTHGRYVWCDDPIEIEFADGRLRAKSDHAEIESGKAGRTLRSAYGHVSSRYFPSNGEIPDPLLFLRPQYNTWIELMYDQNQQGILEYAQALRRSGFPAGVLMIDDNWQEDYGNFAFKAETFHDPKAMIRELHALQFKVMLWVCPFVSPDSPAYRRLRDDGLLVQERTPRSEPAMIRWWNGVSASLDMTNPRSSKWFADQLNQLVDEYEVDGFKFDGGDAEHYSTSRAESTVPRSNAQSEAYAQLGREFPLNEYRACWKMGGQPLAQRLRDKRHSWDDLRALIPGILAQGLMGYAYTCPDMIGGGEYGSFLDLEQIDQELVVRSAQCQALMPMMQFSVAPWRVLDADKLRLCVEAAKLHEQLGKEILALAQESAETGEPIVRHLEYEFPNEGFGCVDDQFMLGSEILVAPVIEKGAVTRQVRFPPGNWVGDDGMTIRGPVVKEVDAPLEKLPWFRRAD